MTPPYSPQANSIVERANGIIVSTLKKLTDKNPDKWDELLPNALLAINTTKQNSTKKSPFYLLFGYEPRLPCELHIGSFIDDTPREDQLDLLILARAEAANVYEAHLENKLENRFDLHIVGLIRSRHEISYYTTCRNKRERISQTLSYLLMEGRRSLRIATVVFTSALLLFTTNGIW
ncbi:uncharacterized protein TNCV_2811621 [Trichonephila clavipes]|nr:uncharacterized protein TNCV_2811621 [Trichonephila clavipes]